MQIGELTATDDDIRYAYRVLLGREPDPSGAAHFKEWIADGTVSTSDLARAFFASPEFREKVGKVSGAVVTNLPRPQPAPRLICRACTQRDIDSPTFRYWAQRLGLRPGALHRKPWEWCFITQALRERDVLCRGSRGLGFAVGREPLTALFASMGCEILATDLETASANAQGWVEGNQHAAGLGVLNSAGLCGPELFDSNVRFRAVDMCHIPNDLEGFDFLWSSCAIEHLGGLRAGIDFVLRAMDCLRPGGIAVHTTEFNVDSDADTIESGHDVIYRKRDLLDLAQALHERGHAMEPFDFDTGSSDADRHVDEFPYTGKVHLKLRIGGFASTSFGLIIRRGESSTSAGHSNP